MSIIAIDFLAKMCYNEERALILRLNKNLGKSWDITERKVLKLATWKLTKEQLDKISKYAEVNDKTNPHVKMIPDIKDGVLLSISVRFLVPRSWRDVVPESLQLQDLICGEIERRSRYRLFPERSELLWRGVLELKYSSVHRGANEQYVIEAMKFIADDLIDVLMGKKELP